VDSISKKIKIGYFISRNEEKQEWTIDRSRETGNNSILSHDIADLLENILNEQKQAEEPKLQKSLIEPYNYYTKAGCFRYFVIR
jgi:predicted metal-dependent phosphoesterase TrpH